ncbi:hypothetical protein WN51_00994 [Melipona quadrifasciata]|uniref:Uncharacterized protein n=1 Tax=Melipona quadrifasciata TaxID=166423 RepID=A0A0M8ZYE4_9HYME|nr:hypothetical protein WN51_00994 [Melipona quadrifasciata]
MKIMKFYVWPCDVILQTEVHCSGDKVNHFHTKDVHSYVEVSPFTTLLTIKTINYITNISYIHDSETSFQHYRNHFEHSICLEYDIIGRPKADLFFQCGQEGSSSRSCR